VVPIGATVHFTPRAGVPAQAAVLLESGGRVRFASGQELDAFPEELR
jgi:hypothetical protein